MVPKVLTDSFTRILSWEEPKLDNLLLQDDIYQSCSWLIKVLMIKAVEREFAVIFLTFDQASEDLLPEIWTQDGVKIIDGMPDDFVTLKYPMDTYFEKIKVAIEDFKREGWPESVVIINSVNLLAEMILSPYKLFTSISPLVQGRLVLIYHGDANPSMRKDLDYLCHTHLTLRNSHRQLLMATHYIDTPGYLAPYAHPNSPTTHLVDLVHWNQSGKVLRERAIMKVEISSDLVCNVEYSPYVDPNSESDAEAVIPEKPNDSLPSDISTFNLNLTDKQREARADLVLPYLSGTITYHPDEGDDFDEDDPDADLEI